MGTRDTPANKTTYGLVPQRVPSDICVLAILKSFPFLRRNCFNTYWHVLIIFTQKQSGFLKSIWHIPKRLSMLKISLQVKYSEKINNVMRFNMNLRWKIEPTLTRIINAQYPKYQSIYMNEDTAYENATWQDDLKPCDDELLKPVVMMRFWKRQKYQNNKSNWMPSETNYK